MINSSLSKIFNLNSLKNNYNQFGYVAHSLGVVGGNIYTNSRNFFKKL